jgi:NADPH:quinone reductase-like Zn-dependent oxidoreductase
MKAILCAGYGSPDDLHIGEVETPVPIENQILIKILATTVTSGDCRIRSLNVPMGFALIVRLVFGVFKPRQPILGTELDGRVIVGRWTKSHHTKRFV